MRRCLLIAFASKTRRWLGPRKGPTHHWRRQHLPIGSQDDSYAAVPRSGFRQRNQAPVAQLDRAPDYESGGQEFESLRARQQLFDFDSEISVRIFPHLTLKRIRAAPGKHPVQICCPMMSGVNAISSSVPERMRSGTWPVKR